MKGIFEKLFGNYTSPEPYYTVPSYMERRPDEEYYPLFCSNSVLAEKRLDYGIIPKTRTTFYTTNEYGKIKQVDTNFTKEEFDTIVREADTYFHGLDFDFIQKVRYETRLRETYRIPQISFKMKLFRNYIYTPEGIGICYYDLIITVSADTGCIMSIVEV